MHTAFGTLGELVRFQPTRLRGLMDNDEEYSANIDIEECPEGVLITVNAEGKKLKEARRAIYEWLVVKLEAARIRPAEKING